MTITVTDVNDVSPQCPDLPTSFTVAEANTLEVRIGQITATDGDSGTNAIVNYRIAAGDISGQFRIATTTVSSMTFYCRTVATRSPYCYSEPCV